MKRTLLAVGVALLASMMWIAEYKQYVGRYRRPIFALNQYEIDWGQMILQPIFAAVAAAVISNSRCQWLREREPGTMHSSSLRTALPEQRALIAPLLQKTTSHFT